MRARICTAGDILALTALPTSHAHDARRGADVLSRHTRLLFAWADQVALGVTQRVFDARIVTYEDAVNAEMHAASADWYEWAKQTADAEGDAVALRRAAGAYTDGVKAWARVVFALRAEQWQPDTDERRVREQAAQTRIAELATARDAAAAALTAALSTSDIETAALAAHWARVAAGLEARAKGIASTDGRTLRQCNALQAEAIRAAAELGAQLDAAVQL